MNRRGFVKAGVLTLAVAAVVPVVAAEKPWQEMTPEELTRENLRKRRAGVAPNYEQEHECSKCGLVYLCPDRYVMHTCAPTDFEAKFGRTNRLMLCLPCAASLGDDMRWLWREAHGV